jgi:dCMP deaminase
MRPSKDEYYLEIARQVAQRGTCIRRKVGAVIVKNDAIISTGYVGSPRGTENCIDKNSCFRRDIGIPSGQRYELCKSVHAEQNAIINAARNGNNILEGVMYLADEKNLAFYPKGKQELYGPCMICKKAIINSGLKELVVKSDGGVSRISIEDIKKALLEEESQMRSQNEVKAAKI